MAPHPATTAFFASATIACRRRPACMVGRAGGARLRKTGCEITEKWGNFAEKFGRETTKNGAKTPAISVISHGKRPLRREEAPSGRGEGGKGAKSRAGRGGARGETGGAKARQKGRGGGRKEGRAEGRDYGKTGIWRQGPFIPLTAVSPSIGAARCSCPLLIRERMAPLLGRRGCRHGVLRTPPATPKGPIRAIPTAEQTASPDSDSRDAGT